MLVFETEAQYSSESSSHITISDQFAHFLGNDRVTSMEDFGFRDNHMNFFLDDPDIEMENFGNTLEGAAILETLGNTIFGNGISDFPAIHGNFPFPTEDTLMEMKVASTDKLSMESGKPTGVHHFSPVDSFSLTNQISIDCSTNNTGVITSPAGNHFLKSFSENDLPVHALPSPPQKHMERNNTGLSSGYNTYPQQPSHPVEPIFQHSSLSKGYPDLEELWDYFSYCHNQSTGGMNQSWRVGQHQNQNYSPPEMTPPGTRFWFPTQGRNVREDSKLRRSQQGSFDESTMSLSQTSSPTLQDPKILTDASTDGGYSSSTQSPTSPSAPVTPSQIYSMNEGLGMAAMLGGKNTRETQLCSVCGDNAICQHYGVRTCEGCKGFFKRTVQKGAKYSCLADRNCPVDKRRRNRCQFCRFQKCLAVGMQKEVVRMNSLKGRRGRLPSKAKTHQQQNEPTSPVSLITELVRAHLDTSLETADLDYTRYNKMFLTNEKVSPTSEEIRLFYVAFVQSIEVIKNWAEKVPGFTDLCSEDQRLLLHSAALELFSLRIADRIRTEDDNVKFCNGLVLHRGQCISVFEDWIDSIYRFATSLERLSLDVSSVACLSALTLITPRHGLKEPKKVELLQTKIINALKDHTANYGDSETRSSLFSQILGKLPQLRTLSWEGNRQLERLERLKYLVPPPALIRQVFLGRDLPF